MIPGFCACAQTLEVRKLQSSTLDLKTPGFCNCALTSKVCFFFFFTMDINYLYAGFRYAPYIAWIPLLAHGLTVKLSHSSVVGRIAACLCWHSKCNLLLAQGRPQDGSASY